MLTALEFTDGQALKYTCKTLDNPGTPTEYKTSTKKPLDDSGKELSFLHGQAAVCDAGAGVNALEWGNTDDGFFYKWKCLSELDD